MNYPINMDLECIPLCDALNSFNGIKTISSCSGHGEDIFRIYFRYDKEETVNFILSHIESLATGEYWICSYWKNMPSVYCLHSIGRGESVYSESREIARYLKSLSHE